MDTSLRRRRSERQEPDAPDAAQAEALAAIPEKDSEGPPRAEISESHPFWSERAKAEVELQKARPKSLNEAKKTPEVKVDEDVLEPSYEMEFGGKGKGDPSTSEVVRAASGLADSHGARGRGGLFQEPTGESRGLLFGKPGSSGPPEPTDWMSMSPMKLEQSLKIMMDGKSLKTSTNEPPADRRSMPELETGWRTVPEEVSELSGGQQVRNFSASEVLDPRVVGASRGILQDSGAGSSNQGTPEVSTTVGDGASERHCKEVYPSFSGSPEIPEEFGLREGYPLPPVPPLPFASEGWSSWNVSDPLHSTHDLVILGQEPPRQSSLDMDFGPSVHSPMAFPGDMVPSMDFGLHSFTGFLRWTLDFILPRVLDLSTSLCLPAYNPSNPTALGDWIAVVQPMISSLSDTGSVWWGYTYQAANQAYVRWLSTSPLERLSIQKEFDQVNLVQPQHALLEQRCVTLILQAIPDAVRVDIVASRHLSVAGMIFRLMTVFQPGGASERSTMLRFLVTPKAASTLSEAAKLLRQWTQWRMRLKQLHAAEPDTTLLVKGLDVLTGKVLQKHSASLFRLATFRERLGVDYQPTSDAVSELCRMMQAEVEHLMHSTDDNPVKDEVPGRGDDAKKQRLQRLQTSPSTPKAKTSPAGPKSPGAGMKPCRSWLTAGGCTYGSSCQFYHDQDEEKMRGRCFCCSAEDHWADSCPVKARLKAEAKAANEAEAAAPSQGDGNAAINAEILSVLRSIKTKALRLSAVSNPTGYGLLDSGASASLRQASPQEIQESRPVSVSLAVGEALMHVNSAGNLLVRESVQPILPMHALRLLGCEINWTDRGIHVRHPGLGILPVRLKDGTPELPEFLVLRLIAEYERFLLRRETSRAVSQQLWQRSVGQEEVGLSSLREWVAAHVAADSCSESELQLIVKTLFPGLPERLASQVAVSPTFDPSCVPFNRRTRRQLFDPQVPTLVHLFAGKQRWRHSVGQVLEVDISRGSDLLSDDVFGMLLRAATLGVIDGVVCGPPSRTFNPEALASSSNGLKFRGEEGDDRFGFSDLSPSDRALVDRDTLLFLRSLLLTFVASCAKEKFFNCLEMPETSTAWEWPEYENVSVCLGGWTASFDQGTLGHPCSKATAVYTSSFQLYESLHELKLPPEVIEAPASNFYGKEWAPGLVSRVLRAWDDYCCVSFERLQAHTREREGLLLNLCQEATVAKMSPEVWERHCQADHLPYRNDCPICIQGASRDRSHFTKHPHLFELSSDVAGPYHKGRDFGGACRYFVIFTIRVPVKSDKKEWRDKSSEIAFQEKVDEAKAQDKEDPHASLIYQPQPSRVKVYTKLGDDFLEEPSSAVGVSSTPGEDDDSALPVSFEVKSPHKPPPLQPEGSDSDDGQEFVTLVWAEPLKTRQSFNVQLAIMRAVARLRAFGIPCFRFHSDRAREYLSDSLERFLAEQGIHSTRTAPEDHPSNGAAEVAIREVKRAARRALLSANLPSCHWPTAVRHAGEVMWRKGLVRLGGAARSLLAYGTPVEARKRLRHRDVWMSRTRSGVLIGPAPQTLSSYLVLFEDDTVCITSAVYPVDYRPRPPSEPAEPPLRPKPLSGSSTGAFLPTPHYRHGSKGPSVRVTLQGPSLPAAGGMSAIADFSDFYGSGEFSRRSFSESEDSLKAGSDGPVDFLSDSSDFPQTAGMPEVPQQEFSTLQGVCEDPAASDEVFSSEDRRESGEDSCSESPGEIAETREADDAPGMPPTNLGEGSRGPGEPCGHRVLRFVGPNPQRMPEANPAPGGRNVQGINRRVLQISFAYMSPDQWAAVCYLEEEEFERQMSDFTRFLDPGDPVDGDTEIPFLLLRGTLRNHRWDRYPTMEYQDADGRRAPLFEEPPSPLAVPGPIDPPHIRALRVKDEASSSSGSYSASSSQGYPPPMRAEASCTADRPGQGYSSPMPAEAPAVPDPSGSVSSFSSGSLDVSATGPVSSSSGNTSTVDTYSTLQSSIAEWTIDPPSNPLCHMLQSGAPLSPYIIQIGLQGCVEVLENDDDLEKTLHYAIRGFQSEQRGGRMLPNALEPKVGWIVVGAMIARWLEDNPESASGYDVPERVKAIALGIATSTVPEAPAPSMYDFWLKKLDHNDRADVNVPTPRWDRRYAVLSDREAERLQRGRPVDEPASGWNELDLQSFGCLVHTMHNPEHAFMIGLFVLRGRNWTTMPEVRMIWDHRHTNAPVPYVFGYQPGGLNDQNTEYELDLLGVVETERVVDFEGEPNRRAYLYRAIRYGQPPQWFLIESNMIWQDRFRSSEETGRNPVPNPQGPPPFENRRDRSPRRDPDAGPAFRVARLFSSSGGSPSATEAFSPCETFCKQVLLEGHPVSTGQLANAIRLYVQDKKAVNRIAKRPLAGNQKDEASGATLPPWFWSSGAWVFSAKVGITNTVHECPWLTRLLAVSLFHRTGHCFASVGFVVNIESEIHRDSHNSLESMNVVWNVGQGSGSLEVRGQEMPLPPNAWLSFPPRDLHKSGSWEGDKILVLGYTPRSLEKLTSSDLLSLRWVNMPIQDLEPLSSSSVIGEPSPGDGVSKLLPDECDSGEEEADLPAEESWSQVTQGYEQMHQAVTHFLKSLQRSVVGASSEGPVDPITLQAMREASSLRNELGWHLELARLYGCDEPVSSSSWRVCAAAPAAEHLESQPLLHTRIVSNEEVREKLHEWRDAMKAECDSLISKGAVELVADSQVEKWILDGEDVEILPGRGVATEKPPVAPGSTKRNKYRAVICGNFQKWSEERAAESFYAGGADSLSIRTALRWAGMRKHGGSGTDVKTAFLNAPLDEQEAEYLICNPPKVLYAAGVIPRGYKWRVHGALYGLQTSPRAWSRLRDKTCRVLTWTVDGENRHLQQCVADPNIWLVKSPCGETVALMCWYVDDLLVLGPWSERSALLEKIKATWECSAFTHTEDGPVEYCGLEISESADGLLIGQTKYIKELLKRHNVQGSAKSPCAAWSANFDDGESRDDPVDPEAVKAAQSITGELLWLSVRARPELSFPVSRMAQLTTKRPKDALSIGQGVLRFLNSSPSQCIVYGPPPGDCGASQQYPRPVVETTLHAFADASFGPSSGRSHQGLLVCWAGAPLHWESGRQTLTALSTAESELISYVCVVQAAEAVEALIGEIFPEPLTRSLFGDNSSAISIVSGPPTSWRSRHLRLRSHALRERIENGVWTVYHLSGLLMPADILTKAMTASKFGDMLPFLGVKNPSEDCRLRLAAVLACCALLLKGQGSPEPEGWGWVIVYLTVVILAYEGFRSFLRRFLGLVAYVFPGLGARFPGVLDVHSSPGTGTTQPPAASTPPSSSTQLPAPGARLPRGSSSSIGARLPGGAPSSSRSLSNLRSIGVNTNPEDYAPLPPVLPAAPAAAYRHPIDLVSHSTSSGSHWHQNPECYHLRNRDHSSLLPCSDCVVGRTVFHTNLPTGLRRRRGG
ncbi:RE1 [Symbiodinium sp. CCMP2592]|nr:RE1 [Symbiodinium sp. CCMP2592]